MIVELDRYDLEALLRSQEPTEAMKMEYEVRKYGYDFKGWSWCLPAFYHLTDEQLFNLYKRCKEEKLW